ncbi:MAG TPA: hypothetical protein VF172_08095 [Nitrososphaera sp.]|jgi:hypothetical protein
MNDAQRTILFSIILLVGMSVPSQLLHELGHASACSSSGLHYDLKISFAMSSTVCNGMPDDLLWYYASGGIVAGVAFFSLGFMPFLAVKIASWSIAVANALAGLLEGFFRDAYFSLEGFVAVQIFAAMIFIFLLYGLGLQRLQQTSSRKAAT